MKIADYRADYYAFSSKTSEIARHLSFAGIALVWMFKAKDAAPADIPLELLLPAGLFVLSLGMDILHAAYGTFVWGAFSRFHEKKHIGADEELDAPSWFNWPSLLLFWGKVSAVIIGYAITLAYIWRLMSGPY